VIGTGIKFQGVPWGRGREKEDLVKGAGMALVRRQGEKLQPRVADGSLRRDAHDPVIGRFVDRLARCGEVDDRLADLTPGVQYPLVDSFLEGIYCKLER
jgi:hypothetical protein